MDDERELIKAKKDYHMAVSEAWRVYDKAVEEARVVRDDALDKIGDHRDPDVWRVYNESTLAARIVFEEAIKPTRLKKNVMLKTVKAKVKEG